MYTVEIDNSFPLKDVILTNKRFASGSVDFLFWPYLADGPRTNQTSNLSFVVSGKSVSPRHRAVDLGSLSTVLTETNRSWLYRGNNSIYHLV